MWWLFLQSFGLILLLTLLIYSLFSLMKASMVGAPFVPAPANRIKAIEELIQPRPGLRIVDLGSGDGRVVRHLAKHGATVDGYEIQWLLVWWSRLVSKINRLPTTHFYRRDLFDVKLADYDVVVIYGLPHMMARLRDKFEAELQAGARVLTITFPLPQRIEAEKRNGVYLYRIGSGK